MGLKILIAPDKFRGSLNAEEVCEAVKSGARMALPDASLEIMTLADGGEGTVQILMRALDGVSREVEVMDPLGRPVSAVYGLNPEKKTAFIEMAAASGLALLHEEERNPLATSTYGTGQLIADAIDQGAETIYLGIGGSATTDAGLGMAKALGFRFLDLNGNELEGTGSCLQKVVKISEAGKHPGLDKIKVIVLSDVTNPLSGTNGAAWVYGPQKGASPEMVARLDKGLVHINKIASAWSEKNISEMAGAGAAGGLGAGAIWFLNAEIRGGADSLIELTGLKDKIRQADLVITGEGKVDFQTLQGKVIGGLAKVCRENHKPLAVICGALLLNPSQIKEAGITYAVSVLNRPVSEKTAFEEAFERVEEATFNLVRLFSYRNV